jgi:predicted amidophosphoribosyltransferase
MPVSYRDTARWKHKQSAIRQFAHDLNNLPFNDDILIPAATSKSEDDINYDSRIVDTLLGLKRINPSIHVLDILKVKTSTASAHSEGGTRRPYDIIEGLEPIENPPKIQQERIFVVDDILTTGGHFKAYKTFLERYYPNVQIIGIFWALHIF